MSGYNWRKHLRGGARGGRGKAEYSENNRIAGGARSAAGRREAEEEGEGEGEGGRELVGGGEINNVNLPQEDEEEVIESLHANERVWDDLLAVLRRIDGRQYGAYKEVMGGYKHPQGAFTLYCDHVQSDAYAPPSRFSVRVPHSAAKFPGDSYGTRIRNIALCDYLARLFTSHAKQAGLEVKQGGGGWGGCKGGDLSMARPSQHVLQRNSVIINAHYIEARFTVGLPARGRTVMGALARDVLSNGVTNLVHSTFLIDKWPPARVASMWEHIRSVEDQDYLRRVVLPANKWIGFVADKALLARESGASDVPLPPSSQTPFTSPLTMRGKVKLPNRGEITGMPILPGVTLIVGGGFHGKSTLLRALQVGVYNHVPGDGREFVVMDASAVKIRAEDGRQVHSVDVSSFIQNLPNRISTSSFSTSQASGSTSQAANIIEALEAGSRVLLLDEDTCATNFMIRDAKMAALIPRQSEPIRAFITQVRSLYEDNGVSTVLVMGGCGEYLGVSDQVVCMDCFTPKDLTSQAKEISRKFEITSLPTERTKFGGYSRRVLVNVKALGKTRVQRMDTIELGDRDNPGQLDLNCVEQLVELGQTRALSDFLIHIQGQGTPRTSITQLLDGVEAAFDNDSPGMGLDVLTGGRRGMGCHTRPRRYEIAAAFNRLRSATFGQLQSEIKPK